MRRVRRVRRVRRPDTGARAPRRSIPEQRERRHLADTRRDIVLYNPIVGEHNIKHDTKAAYKS